MMVDVSVVEHFFFPIDYYTRILRPNFLSFEQNGMNRGVYVILPHLSQNINCHVSTYFEIIIIIKYLTYPY